MMAPGMEPSPPMAAATKAVMPMALPSMGLMFVLNRPMKIPAMPARIEPMTKAMVRMEVTGTPICNAACESWDVALMAWPVLP